MPLTAESTTPRPPGAITSEDSDSNATWIRVGIGIAAAGNAINTAYTLAFISSLNANRWREICATIITVGAWTICRRRPQLAAAATISAVWMELGIALMTSGRLMDEVLAVFPLLVLVAGLFWGRGGAITLTIASSIAIPLAVYLGGSWGDDFSRFTATDGHILVVVEIVIVATAMLTTAGMEALRQLNAELESRVAHRTRELAARVVEVERLAREQEALMREVQSSQEAADRSAARLQEANAHLLSANLELEAFSYSVSHDLRAPLRNVTGFLELLRGRLEKSTDDEGRRYITVVTKETARMGELIDDLLTFSKIGRTEMSLQPVALDPIVAAVREDLKAELGGRVLEWRISPLPVVRGDPVLLRQVLANLVGNAVKFTRLREFAWIEIGAQLPADPAKLVTVFVRDNGAGFNPKYSAKLFGVFQRLHNTREFEGTGIGLANVKRIVTRHGGHVWAEGEVDRGATFYFSIPPARTA